MHKLFKKNPKHTDLFFLLFVSIGFFLLMSFDINSWYYSAIGDEYAFYIFARDISLKKKLLSFTTSFETINVFDQTSGIYDISPIAYIYQSMIMNIFGTNHFGWILSTIIIVILSGWLLFFLCKEMFSQEIARLSALFFFSSQYLWGFTHLGYPNLQPIFITLASLFFFYRGLKSGRLLPFLGSGIMTGLGFYTYYSSRVVIFILIALILAKSSFFIRKKMRVVSLFCGFLILFIPFIVFNRYNFVEKMFTRSIIASREIPGNRSIQFFENIFISISGFFHNEKTSHFVSGSLIDPLSAVFASTGFVLILFSLQKNLPILIWFILALATTGGLSQYTHLSITRLHFLLPIIAILAGFAFSKTFSFLRLHHLWRIYATIIVFVIIYSLNLFRFYFLTPKKMDLTPEAITIGALTSLPACKKKAVILYKHYIPLLLPAISSYHLSTKVTYISDPSEIDQENINREINNFCLINVDPKDTVFTSFLTNFFFNSNLATTYFYSPSRNRYVQVFYKN